MLRIPVICLLALYSMGTLLLPLGDFASMRHLPQMYEQCKAEDPDINPADFVFEHLLNLEDIIDRFENEDRSEEQERPHQPLQHVQSVSQVVINIHQPLQFDCGSKFLFPVEKRVYPLHNDAGIPSAYLSQIFRPPTICRTT